MRPLAAWLVPLSLVPVVVLATALFSPPGLAEDATTRTQAFDRDPGWDGHNNRSTAHRPRPVRQDFGWSRTANAGGRAGEVGGFITPDAAPAYYAKALPAKRFNDRMSASGTVVVPSSGATDHSTGNTLLGFFNSKSINEWRTPSTIVLRLNGRGDGFHVHLEYCSARWRAGGVFYQHEQGEGLYRLKRFASEKPHPWSLAYDPAGNHGGGTITAVFDGESLVCNLGPGHQADGATFDRFGLLNVMKSADDGGPLWLDDVMIDGLRDSFDRDPGWSALGNHQSYLSTNVRPRFNFGYSATNYAGGKAKGEIGGLLFRGDEREPDRLAYYGDRLEALSLEKPLTASGKVTLRRAVTDSSVLFGFFHSEGSMKVNPGYASQVPENFVGAVIEGPSREGFLVYPGYGIDRESQGVFHRYDPLPPHLLPDGKTHDWKLEYSPTAGTSGRITVTLDGKSSTLDLTPEHRAVGARFNCFGFVTTHTDGNGQEVFLDDLTYTFRQ
jgi:hypothetical protein